MERQWRTVVLKGPLGFLAASAFVVGMTSMTLAQSVEPIVTPQPLESAVLTADRIRVLYRVRRYASLRAEPRFDAQPHASLAPGEQILVTGKVGDPLWCKVETRDGLRGFLIGSLVRVDEDATPIDLALWPDEVDGSITLTPVSRFEIRVFDAEALTVEDKRQIQWALVYLGHYDGVVDGQLGKRSLDAIRGFQRSQGNATSGQLTLSQYRILIQEANDRLSDDAMLTLHDRVAGYRVDYPSRLLPKVEQTAPSSWRLHDEAQQAEISITVGPDDADLPELFEQASLSGQTTYRRLMDRLFVIAGRHDASRFYHVAKVGADRPIQLRLIYRADQSQKWDRFATMLFNSFHVAGE